MNPSDGTGHSRPGVSRRSVLGGGAAVATAVPLLATGAGATRIRSLPISIDKLL